MSPTEDDLRHALSDSAGDVPDAAHIATHARAQRARRRNQVLGAVATVLVVGGIATGGTLLAGGGHRPAAGGPAGVSEPADGRTSAAPHSPVVCPALSPVSVGGASSPSAATGKLFASPVSTVFVCAYSASVRSAEASSGLLLSGVEARTLTDSLENATKTRPTTACPLIRMENQATLVIRATGTDGKGLPAVTTTINEPACAVVVSNGTAVRYDWSLPTSLRSRITGLVGSAGTSGRPVGLNGSPAH